MKEFQTLLNESIAVVAIAGFAFGMMILKKTPNLEQPSMIAEFSKSFGILRKNFLKKKMLNAFAPVNMQLRKSAKYVFVRFISTMILKFGISVTWLGIIIVATNIMNMTFLPLNLRRVSAYAVMDAMLIMAIGIAIDRNDELRMNFPKGRIWNSLR